MNCAITLFLLISASYSLDCLNQQGQPVDWWVIHKMSKESSTEGNNFYYSDPSVTLQYSTTTIDTLQAPFLRTVAQQSIYTIAWNDQKSDGTYVTNHAHSKGVIKADSNSGFVINHSLPKFPYIVDDQIQLIYPSNALFYGQHISCFSTSTTTLDSIAPLYMYAEVQVLLGKADPTYKNLYKLANYRFGQISISQLIMSSRLASQQSKFYTKRGMLVNMFAKVDSDHVEFYEHIVTPVLQDNMIVETWGNGSQGLDDPICNSQFQVVSNLFVSYDEVNSYKYTKDHSKFGITTSKKIVCVSDINRQQSQYLRGGTAFCFENVALWSALRKSMIAQQSC